MRVGALWRTKTCHREELELVHRGTDGGSIQKAAWDRHLNLGSRANRSIFFDRKIFDTDPR